MAADDSSMAIESEKINCNMGMFEKLEIIEDRRRVEQGLKTKNLGLVARERHNCVQSLAIIIGTLNLHTMN